MQFQFKPTELTTLPLRQSQTCAVPKATTSERSRLLDANNKESSGLGNLTTILLISAIAFFVVVLLGTATLLLREESELVTEARAEIFAPAAASAHSAELILNKMLKAEDAESFDDGAVKLNNTAAVLRAAAARIAGLRRNHTKSILS